MTFSPKWLLLLFALAGIVGAGTAADSCSALFRENRFAEAADCLNRTLYTTPDSDTASMAALYEGLGVNYMMQNRKPLAAAAFSRLVALRPDHEIDPNAYLPEIVTFYQSIKLDAKSRKVPLPADPVYAPLLHVLPLGAPQFANREKVKGLTVLAWQALSLGISVYCYSQKKSLYSDEFGYAENDVASARGYDRAYKTAFLAFSAGYLYSLVDGFIKPKKRGAAW